MAMNSKTVPFLRRIAPRGAQSALELLTAPVLVMQELRLGRHCREVSDACLEFGGGDGKEMCQSFHLPWQSELAFLRKGTENIDYQESRSNFPTSIIFYLPLPSNT
jgi:hypothetical protein